MHTKSRHTKPRSQRDYAPNSSRGRHSAGTLLAQVAAQLAEQGEQQAVSDRERGDRIKARREELHLTQPAVVDLMEEAALALPRTHDLHPANAGKAPVTLRGFQTYERGGGIVWEKAKLLAQVLQMDVSEMMNGPREETPDLVGALGGREENSEPVDVRLDVVEGTLARILERIGQQLDAQTDVLNEIKDLLSSERESAATTRDAAADAREIVREIQEDVRAGRLRAPARSSKRAAPKTAPKTNPRP